MKLLSLFVLIATAALAAAPLAPMLNLAGVGGDPDMIDYARLPVIKGGHSLVTKGPHAAIFIRDAIIFDFADVNDPEKWNFRRHSYLAYFDGEYWAMWSHGRVGEDHPTQHLRYAVSADGSKWSEPRMIAGPPTRDGFRYISRGLWVRDGKLLALASLDEAYNEGRVGFFGYSLQLHAWEWLPAARVWLPMGMIANAAISNFPPARMPNGEWAMICREAGYRDGVFVLTGGLRSAKDWQRSPIESAGAVGFRPGEPEWWPLPDGRLLGLFRDDARSRRFYRAVSADNGRTWSLPEKTNFPDATAKFFCLRTSRGFYALVSNANPKGRNPLCLSTSDDGVTFTRMGRLPIPLEPEGGAFDAAHSSRSVSYPHAIEHDGHLLVCYSRNQIAIEVIKVPLDEVERLRSGTL